MGSIYSNVCYPQREGDSVLPWMMSCYTTVCLLGPPGRLGSGDHASPTTSQHLPSQRGSSSNSIDGSKFIRATLVYATKQGGPISIRIKPRIVC